MTEGGLPKTSPDGGPPRSRKSGRLGVGGWVSIAVTGVMVLGTLGGYTLYRNTFANINTLDPTANLGANRPVNETGSLNVLLVGSDTREGDNLQYGQKMLNAGKRTDTIILMHISPNRDKATLISFPATPWWRCPRARARTAPRSPRDTR
ncbi:hypothetical protein ACFQX6_33055 [Streptosporangium lutulentum]